MSSISSTTFFQNGTAAQFEYVLALYPQVIKLKSENRYAGKKPEKLTKLDDWYQNTLPKLIQKRGKDAHLQHEELVQTMEWKQTRGKFFPQLTHLIKINTPRAVMMETKKAFRKLPNLEQALNALSNLKGVGITMASALLAAASPDTAPFMADECLNAIPDFENIDYTAKEYLKFVTHIQSTQDRLNKEVHGSAPEPESNGGAAEEANGESKPKKWSAHAVELALWTHYVASDLQPDLLKGMPESNGVTNGSSSSTSVSISNNAVDDEEDENSQNGAPPSDESNPASEEGAATPMITNGNADSLDGSENGTVAEVVPEVAAPEVPTNNAEEVAAAPVEDFPESLDDCTKSGDSLDGAPAVEATAAAVATLCTADSTDLVVAAAAVDSDSQSSNSQKRPLYCDDNSEEQPELSAPKLIKL